jgi:hypothetical protein
MALLVIEDTIACISIGNSETQKGAAMKLRTALFSIVILTVLFLSAFGSPPHPRIVKLQDTIVPLAVTTVAPAITVMPATVIVQGTPAAIPVTGGSNTGIWTIVLFGLLALLGLAFLLALFLPRTNNEPVDRNPPLP